MSISSATSDNIIEAPALGSYSGYTGFGNTSVPTTISKGPTSYTDSHGNTVDAYSYSVTYPSNPSLPPTYYTYPVGSSNPGFRNIEALYQQVRSQNSTYNDPVQVTWLPVYAKQKQRRRKTIA